MEVFILALAVVSFTLAPVEGIRKCEKIDACRCSTDEGEISLWSLAGQTPNSARFNISSSSPSTYYQWNPCAQWTDQRHPCEDAAVCQVTRKTVSETSYVNIGERKASDCVLDEQNGQCVLTYGVTGNNEIKTSIALVCDETVEGKVDPMISDLLSYSTSLHSMCACPGKCSLAVKGDMGIQFATADDTGGLSIGAIVGIAIGGVVLLILLAFAIFICCLRRKLPSGLPKPSICTTVKVALGMIKKKLCPCC